uniref:membrane-associated phosphatidylinositol transfer protein 3-like n=1 Tax=Pristiophorus japonicus TaxID=55135 RepID=UPI00398EEF08
PRLSPYGYEDDGLSSSPDQIPLAALPLLATSSAQYREVVAGVVTRSNQAYSEFLRSEEGTNFKGQVCLIGDCVGGIVGFDALCNIAGSPASSRRGSVNTERLSPEILIDSDPLANPRLEGTRQLSKSNNELSMGTSLDSQRGSPRKHSNSSTSDIDSMKQHHTFLSTLQANVLKGDGGLRRTSSSSMINLDCSERFDFDVSDFFLFGCPLGLVLALRKMVAPGLELSQFQPACQQIYNLFHPADPLACRLEPLLTRDFHLIPPFVIPRYQKFPLGDGNSSLLVDTLQSFTSIFSGVPEPSSTTTLTPALGDLWRPSDHSSSGEGGLPQPGSPIPCDVARVIDKWWGSKRIDYALYCPDALTAFPTVTLPHLFHASYWESTDVVAFILRQVMRQQNVELEQVELETSDFCPPLPQEKWLRKRTQVKIRNVASNHRATDVVAVVGAPQVLSGRFTYGPLDVVTLTGEKVDVYIMTEPPLGKWIQCGTETTNSSGRITCLLPQDKRLPLGMYPVRMFVRGDHTYGECYLSVLPKGTECVVFSIDGSFAASVSIMGSDPKVRAGAVDVVRHWQDRGYLIVYVTGRPDMQKQKVVAWLSQHNFPHGIVSFCDGLVHDPLRQKTAFLQNLVQEAEMKIEAAYGSTKDISVYGLLRIPAQYTYIVGRPSKKWFGQCQFLTEGYVTHLAQLEGRRISVTPTTNARAALAKGSFGGAGRGHFPRPPVAPSPPGRCRSEKGGSGGTSERGPKPRSISLKFDSEP